MNITTKNTPAPDYGEPWKNNTEFIRDRMDFKVAAFRDAESADRIVACVNACAGMADPAATIAAMREAIREAHEAIEEARIAIFYEVGTWKAVDPCLPKSASAITKLQPFLDA